MKEEHFSLDTGYRPWNIELNAFCMLMHLSQFAGLVIPIAGLMLPIIMWATNKDQSETIDQHGKNIINWILSSIIYVVVSVALIFLFVGFFTLLAVVCCSIIFTIIGAVKANNGEFYEYPLSIKFIK